MATYHIIIFKFVFLLVFFVPIVVLIGCYLGIFLKMRKLRRELNKYASTKTNPKEEKHRDAKMAKTMLVVILGFLGTSFPAACLVVFDKEDKYQDLRVILDIVLWSGTVINPIIYCIRNEKYRKAYISLCRTMLCLTPKQKVSASQSTSRSTARRNASGATS